MASRILFSSKSPLSSTPKLVFNATRSDPMTRSLSNSVTRLMCSATQQPQPHQESPNKEQTDAIKEDLETKEEDEGEDEGGEHVNKATGEIGGPRGPEPTRFGDWERNGRCSDF